LGRPVYQSVANLLFFQKNKEDIVYEITTDTTVLQATIALGRVNSSKAVKGLREIETIFNV